jgi:hypothetical protein
MKNLLVLYDVDESTALSDRVTTRNHEPRPYDVYANILFIIVKVCLDQIIICLIFDQWLKRTNC